MSWSQRWGSWVLQHVAQFWAHWFSAEAEPPDTAAQKQPVSEGPLSGDKATAPCPSLLRPNVGWKAPSSLRLRLHHLPSGRNVVTTSPQGWHRLHRRHRCSHRPLPSAWLVWASTWQRSQESRQESLTLDTQLKGTEEARHGYCTDTDQRGKVRAAKHGDRQARPVDGLEQSRWAQGKSSGKEHRSVQP